MRIIAWLLVAFAVVMMIFTIFTVTVADRNDRNILGLRFYIVKTDSMSKSENNADLDVHFNAGDIILIKNAKDATALQAGDIIAFLSTNEDSHGETITHMIREVKKSDNGKVLGYVTYGTNTGTNDEALVEPSYVIGVYTGKLPLLGNFFAFVKTTPGYLVCILTPFLLLILYNGTNVIRLFKKYKKEQTEIMDAEKEALAAERRQNEEMLLELQRLKAQLDLQANGGQTPATPTPSDIAEEPSSTTEEPTASAEESSSDN